MHLFCSTKDVGLILKSDKKNEFAYIMSHGNGASLIENRMAEVPLRRFYRR